MSHRIEEQPPKNYQWVSTQHKIISWSSTDTSKCCIFTRSIGCFFVIPKSSNVSNALYSGCLGFISCFSVHQIGLFLVISCFSLFMLLINDCLPLWWLLWYLDYFIFTVLPVAILYVDIAYHISLHKSLKLSCDNLFGPCATDTVVWNWGVLCTIGSLTWSTTSISDNYPSWPCF